MKNKYYNIKDDSNIYFNFNVKIIEILDKWGWLGKVVAKPTPEVEEPKLVGGIHKFKEDP